MTEKLFLIYALVDPIDNQIKYIGKSSSGLERPKSHSSPNSLKKGNTRKIKWITSLLEKDLKPTIVVLDYSENNIENCKKEIEYIKKYRDLDYDLYNILDGGETDNLDYISRKPVVGINLKTKEIREYCKIYETAKDNFSVTKVCAVCKGHKKHHKGWFFYYKDNPKTYIPPKTKNKEILVFDKVKNTEISFLNIHEASKILNLSIKTLREYCRLNKETKYKKFSFGSKSGSTCEYCGDNKGNCHCN